MRRRIAQSLTGLVLALLAVFTIAGPASAVITNVVVTYSGNQTAPPFDPGTTVTIVVTQSGPQPWPDIVVPGGPCFPTLRFPGGVYPNETSRTVTLTAQLLDLNTQCVIVPDDPAVGGNIVTPDPTVLDVTIAPGNLPRTGSDTWREVWLGGILGVAGVAMVIVARRRARLYGID